VLVRAIALLAPSHPRLRLAVVGDGPEESRVRALVDELGIADRVLFAGLRSDVRELLPGFDISCLSSVHEGAPLAVLESMAAGVPVVATDCGALRDLLADPGLREEMGTRARARAEQEFSIEHTVQGYQDLLVGLVSR
jgi:glycosyltransferase involved in cell wall biosynthesis